MPKVTKGKKQWYQILAPAMFRGKVIGEVTLLEPESFIGKVFSVNLMNITNDVRKQNTNVFFEATGVKEGKITTQVLGYKMVPNSIKRVVRRGRNKIFDSFVCRTSDGVHVRIKPIAITISKASSSKMQSLSRELVGRISLKVKKTSFDNLVSNLINQRLQISWRDELKKVYPLKFLEIISLKKEKSKRGLKNIVEVSEEDLKKEESKEEKKEGKEEKPAEKREEVKEKPKELSSESEKGLETKFLNRLEVQRLPKV